MLFEISKKKKTKKKKKKPNFTKLHMWIDFFPWAQVKDKHINVVYVGWYVCPECQTATH